MRSAIVAVLLTLSPSLCMAQSSRAYISGAGGFAGTVDGTSGDALGEAGVRVAPNLYVVGDVGRFHNLAPSLFQPGADAASTDFSAGGLIVAGSAVAPAWYTTGGIRYTVPLRTLRFLPYVTTSIGVARL